MRIASFVSACLLALNVSGHYNNDVNLSFTEQAHKYGYASEMHTIVTEDGYVSQIYRIPAKVANLAQEKKDGVQKPAVLLMHGMLCDMNFWTVNEADMNIPYILVDQGYDVWLGNNRGNRFAL